MCSNDDNVLVTLCGKNPGIITEALITLSYKKRVTVSRIILLTTPDIIKEILSKETLLELNRSIEKMNELFNLNMPGIKKDNIYSAPELGFNENIQNGVFFRDLVFNILRDLCSEDNTIYFSAAAGRKTMSIYAGYAMSVLGRENDRLFHVTAAPEFEKSGKLFPETVSEIDQLEYIDVPFIRMRGVTGREKFSGSYTDIVNQSQKIMDKISKPAEVKIKQTNRSVFIDGSRIKMQPFPLSVYLYLLKQDGYVEGGNTFCDKHLNNVLDIYGDISERNGHYERTLKSLDEMSLPFHHIIKQISLVNSEIRKKTDDFIYDMYRIKNNGNYGCKRYGVDVPVENVFIEE